MELLPSFVDIDLRRLDCKHVNILLAQKGIRSFIIKKKTKWTCGDNRGAGLAREWPWGGRPVLRQLWHSWKVSGSGTIRICKENSVTNSNYDGMLALILSVRGSEGPMEQCTTTQTGDPGDVLGGLSTREQLILFSFTCTATGCWNSVHLMNNSWQLITRTIMFYQHLMTQSIIKNGLCCCSQLRSSFIFSICTQKQINYSKLEIRLIHLAGIRSLGDFTNSYTHTTEKN